MVLTKDAFDDGSSDEQPTFNSNADHPDEVVQPVREVPSQLIAEAKLRHEQAETEFATPQERKQAAVEQAHALSTRPDGSYAQLHETERPTLAVADEQVVGELRQDVARAQEALAGSEPVNSPAGVRREEASARDRAAAADQASADQAAGDKSTAAAKGDAKGSSAK
jgi:hypothetical protein